MERSARQGDPEAIEVLLQAGQCVRVARAERRRALVRGGHRLLPSERLERQVSVRLSLASALRSLGEFERCHDNPVGRPGAAARRTPPSNGSR